MTPADPPDRGAPPDRTRPLRAGICSVTFRGRSIGEVVELAAGAGLETIEWGGDVHVPAGDEVAASEARRRTADAGLEVASYGSYLACSEATGHEIAPVLDTAAALGTTLVRVWCPWGVEPGCDDEVRAEVTRAVGQVAAAAAARSMAVYLEFHGGTLTASAESAVRLLDDVDAPNLLCAWQPPYWDPRSADDERTDLRAIGDRLGHVHVYQWDPDGRRHPLADGAGRWPARLATVDRIGGDRATIATRGRAPTGAGAGADVGRSALLEFVRDDDPAVLAADAAVLRRWIEATRPRPDEGTETP